MNSIEKSLFSLKDEKYKNFHSKLMPTVNTDKIIGVRIPDLRKYAKEIDKTPQAEDFLKILPHKYYEEDNLHGFLIEKIKDYDNCIDELNRFLPYVDNWATCDMMTPKILKKYPDRLLIDIKRWISSSHTYTIRFGIKMLMNFYLDGNFKEEYLLLVCNVKASEYYVKMMQAWYFATALAKQYEKTVLYIENKKLDTWVHNKAIVKACESYRVSDEKKAYLKTLKIKKVEV